MKTKKELSKKVKETDIILNDKELLIKEYQKRNNNLSNYNKIFSVSHLTEKLQKEREKYLKKIEECNKNLSPANYIENKEKLENDFNLLNSIDLEENSDNKKLLYKYINRLQIIFLEKILPKKIKEMNSKDELINLLYQIRYYLFIPYTRDNEIKDVKNFKNSINNLLSTLIIKLYNLKIINTISTNEKADIEIVKNIFYIRMISLEEIYLELIKSDSGNYELYIYDDKDTLEKSISINIEFHKKDRIKLKRKVRLFK